MAAPVPIHGARDRVALRGEVPRPQLTPYRYVALATLAFAAALYTYGSAHFPLTDPDEARYAEIAREMLASGDWVTPHLNFVKYFEKPPLVYWATALSFAGFGQSELAARLPSLLSALGTVALTIWLAVRLYGAATAALAAVILGFGPLFGILAQVLTLDMALTFFLTAALAALWCACATAREEERARRWVRLAYAAVALAVLVKGPVAVVLFAGVALPFVIVHVGWRSTRPFFDRWALALAVAIALPWFLLVGWRNPEFWSFFVVDQHIHRYLSSHEHGEPLWFFVPVIVLALAPWGFAALLDPVSLRAAVTRRSAGTQFLAVWVAVIVGFFSLSSSKLITYVLPAMPPLAILCARALLWAIEQRRTAGLSRLASGLLLSGPAVAIAAAVLLLVSDHWRPQALAPFLFAAALPLSATGLFMRRLLPARPYAALVALGLGWLMLFGIAVAGRGVANDSRVLGRAARAAMGPEDRLAFYRKYVQGVVFYSERRAALIGTRGELKFGSQQGDQSAWFWPGDADLAREWAAPGRLFVLFNRSDLERLRPLLDPPPREIAAKDKKVLVVNRE
ncbi:MAG: phospholipid carrier-dependent glycosyltransferase [Candidatus Binatia bacterium]